jgi:hypothetical protein
MVIARNGYYEVANTSLSEDDQPTSRIVAAGITKLADARRIEYACSKMLIEDLSGRPELLADKIQLLDGTGDDTSDLAAEYDAVRRRPQQFRDVATAEPASAG